MSTTPTKRTRRRYGLEDKERGLAALVLAGGSAENASKALASAGQRIPTQTLQDWHNDNPTRYAELQAELAPRIADRIAAEAEEIAVMLAEAERMLAVKVMQDIGELKPAEASAALRNVTTSKALQVDKLSSPLRGRPTVIHADKSAEQTLTALARAMGFSIDSTADEIPTAELVEDTGTA